MSDVAIEKEVTKKANPKAAAWLKKAIEMAKVANLSQEERSDLSKQKTAERKSEIAKSGGLHADPLASDPQIARLTKERKEANAQLAAAVEKQDEEAESAARTRFSRIEADLEKAQKALNAQGIAPKQRGSEYEGEDKKLGWRAFDVAKDKEKLKQTVTRDEHGAETDEEFALREEQLRGEQEKVRQLQAQRAETDSTTTAVFSPQQRENSKIDVRDGKLHGGESFDPQGAAAGSTLNPLPMSEDREFVMDRDGQMHQFKPAFTNPQTGKQVNTHHSSMLGGAEVAGAGKFSTDSTGEMTSVSNLSGHYKPGVAQMIQTLEALLKQGVFLDQTWTDAEGQAPTGKAAEVLEGYQKLKKAVASRNDLVQTLKGSENKADVQQLEEMQKSVEAMVAQLNAAKKALDTLNIAPANQMNPKAKVEFLDGTAKMAGVDIRNAEQAARDNAANVKDFLMSGGGNKDDSQQKLADKKQLHEELEETMTSRRDELDVQAQSRAEDVAKRAAELRAQIEDLLQEPVPDVEDKAQLLEGRKRMEAALKTLANPTDEQLAEIAAGIEEALKTNLSRKEVKRLQEQADWDKESRELAARAKALRAQVKTDLQRRYDPIAEYGEEVEEYLGTIMEEDPDYPSAIADFVAELEPIGEELAAAEKEENVYYLETFVVETGVKLANLESDMAIVVELLAKYKLHKAEVEKAAAEEQAREAKAEEERLAKEAAEKKYMQEEGFYKLSPEEQQQMIGYARNEIDRQKRKKTWVAPDNYTMNPWAYGEEHEMAALESLPAAEKDKLHAEQS